MRAIIFAGASAFLFAASCAGCGGDENTAPGGSGGSSGDGNVGGAAALGNGGTGASIDAPIDMGSDVATDAFVEGWELAPWNPPGCQFLRATNLAAAVPPLIWKDCENGIAGCVYLDTAMLAGSPNANGDKLGQGYAVAQVAGKTFFAFEPIFAQYVGGAIIYEVGVGPRAAWRSDKTTPCTVGPVSFGIEGGAALTVTSSVDGSITTTILYDKVDPSALDSGSVLKIDKSLTNNAFAVVMHVEFSSSLMALEMGLDALLYVWDFGSGKPVLIPRPPDIAEDYRAIIKGSEMAFVRDSPIATARNFAVRHADGTVETLYKKSSVWAIHLRGDGTEFVWQELNQSTNVLELWTAPFTTAPTSFQPKKVRTVEAATNLVDAGFSGEGWWVYRQGDSTLRAIRLADGMWLDAPAPSGFGWVLPFGVVNGEIWATIFVSPGSSSTVYSIARVPLASLGTPQP